MKKNEKIYIAGHKGLVGSALYSILQSEGYKKIVFRDKRELDLRNEYAVKNFFEELRPSYVFLAAGKVGGIKANIKYPAEFIYENIKIESNIIHYSYKTGVKKLLYIGCSCIYPNNSSQPIKERYLLTGPFEPTNEAYSIAKLAGIKMCQAYNSQYSTNFICCISENIYGPYDNFDMESAHVIPALIVKFHSAKMNNEPEVTIWGSGKPKRGFLYIDDFIYACIFLMKYYNSSEIINVGAGEIISIRELANSIKDIVGYKGKIKFDVTKPDGMPQKFLDKSKLNRLGWQAKTSFREGLRKTYYWYKMAFCQEGVSKSKTF